MSQDITKQAIELQDFIRHSCPNLKGTSLEWHYRLTDIVVHFQSDIEACKSFLKRLNAAYAD